MSEDPNAHVRDYLDYYIGLSRPPRYAVLLNGPWGIGKTYLIREILQNRFQEGEDEYRYVSLYGVTSVEDLDAALLASIYPILGRRGTKIGGRIAKSALKAFNIETDLSPADLLSKFKAGLYVFDDLERCELPLNKVMGYINEFVEHDDCKVIIIANEAEIDDKSEYLRRKEKLIGKTLEVRSSLSKALAAFIDGIQSSFAKQFFLANHNVIAEMFSQSELENLRILQHTMWDFERFSNALSERHKLNTEAMVALLRIMFALSFEVKSGRLTANDLGDRMGAIIASMMTNGDASGKRTGLRLAQARYPDTNLANTILPDQQLIDVLINGVVSVEQIQNALNISPYFVGAADEPAWRAVWHWLERSDDLVYSALSELERQFVEREFVKTGEILHVFGLRLWMSDIGAISKSKNEIVEESKQYVDDLAERNLLEPIPQRVGDDVRFDGYGGLGINEATTPEYRILFDYLKEKRETADRARYPAQAAELLKLMGKDADLFLQKVCLTNSAENVFCDIPVLAAIDPDEFVSALLGLEPAALRTVMSALKARYERDALFHDLAGEVAWLSKVSDKLLQAAQGMAPIGKFRLQKLVQWDLEPSLQRAAGIGAVSIGPDD